MTTEACANPLFLGWVKEWWDWEKTKNSKGVLAYRTAYESLRACPVRFEHASQLQALKGFGPKLCSRVAERMEQHCAANGLPPPARKRLSRSALAQIGGSGGGEAAGRASTSAAVDGGGGGEAAGRASTSAAVDGGGGGGGGGSTTAARTQSADAPKKRSYVPALRQGGYALLMALSSAEARAQPWMAKAELVERAQPHCDTSFTVKPPGKFYTAWDSIKTLLNHELVRERRRPTKGYALTEDGWAMASRLRRVVGEEVVGGPGDGEEDDDDDEGHGRLPVAGPLGDASSDTPPPFIIPAGAYSVQLVLDVRERVTGQQNYLVDELAKHGVAAAVRALSLGDALWVAKCHDPALLGRHGSEGDEVVLDWIVERKRQDDLVCSIKDGRYREQKFRLRRAGLRHVVYVIEESGLDADVLHRYGDAMQSAVASMQLASGYFVKRTRSVDDTIGYLARLTKRLQQRYAARPLRVLPTAALTAENYVSTMERWRAAGGGEDGLDTGISYHAFAAFSSKSETLTLRDVFLKMLLCTRGVTGDRAIEIQRRWKTPHAFLQAYEALGPHGSDEARKRKRDMVADALGALPDPKRRVTKAISERIFEAWAS